jgi:hypothetical protein
MLLPIHVLFIVMAIGIVAWPVAKHLNIIETTQQTDLMVVVVLILAYLAYKTWWEKQQQK